MGGSAAVYPRYPAHRYAASSRGGRRDGLSRRPAETQGALSARCSPWLSPAQAQDSLKDRQRQAREDRVLMRVTTVILIPTAVALIVIIFLLIATHR